jgi:CheY-like chemotaxis protein
MGFDLSGFEGKTILLAEDEEDLRAVVQESFEGEGMKVIAVASGNEAFAVMQSDEGEGVDLILSDIRMADGSGISLLERLSEEDMLGDRPFILYSGFSEDISRESAKAMGAYDLLEKPFKFEDIIQALGQALGLEKNV